MIDPHATRAQSSRRLWAGTIRQLFQALDLHGRETASEISESLAVFCEQHPHVSARTLSLLMARSFCAAGDRDAAGRVLRHDPEHRGHADSWLEVLSAEYPFPELYPLFGSRALRPLRLKTVGCETTWVLDLQQIHVPEADRHELILLQTLRVLTEKVSNVWNKEDGKGTLVVKGLPCLSDVILSGSQMIKYVQDVLHNCAVRNGWASVPAVLLLDL